jgi:hypothetical protein
MLFPKDWMNVHKNACLTPRRVSLALMLKTRIWSRLPVTDAE